MRAPSFPDYVPEKVRLRAAQLRHGDVDDPSYTGWLGVLEGLRTRLDEVEQRLRDPGILAEETLEALRRQRRDLSAQVDQTGHDLDCLDRLTARPDRDLQRVYELLEAHLKDDEEVWSFIYAAIAANIEFARYRDALKSARERKREIAKQAQVLAELLDSFDGTGIHAPDVFWSVRSLLEHTDASGKNSTLWQQMRGRLLGENHLGYAVDNSETSTGSDLDDDYDEDFPDDDFVVAELEDGVTATTTEEQDRRYAWQVAPSVSDLLQALATAAREFEPREHGMIGTATAKRQDSEKAAYIRAFAHLLGEHGIDLNPGVKNAMATTATLVLNHQDLVVTIQDVGNTLSRR